MSQAGYRGGALRQRREEREISYAEIYECIHIPPRYTQALEEGDFSVLPGETYALGFLRTYCRYLDLDPEPYVDSFRAARSFAAPRAARPAPVNPDPDPRPLWVREAIAFSAICAVLLLGWVTYATVVRPFTEDAEIRVNAGTVEVAPPVRHFDEDL